MQSSQPCPRWHDHLRPGSGSPSHTARTRSPSSLTFCVLHSVAASVRLASVCGCGAPELRVTVPPCAPGNVPVASAGMSPHISINPRPIGVTIDESASVGWRVVRAPPNVVICRRPAVQCLSAPRLRKPVQINSGLLGAARVCSVSSSGRPTPASRRSIACSGTAVN